jgi:hypothetical protein
MMDTKIRKEIETKKLTPKERERGKGRKHTLRRYIFVVNILIRTLMFLLRNKYPPKQRKFTNKNKNELSQKKRVNHCVDCH